MTGFGAASGEEGEAQIRVELRSVNHRHLLVKTRLPSELLGLESEIEAAVRKKLDRGSVGLTVTVLQPSSSRAAQIDEGVLLSYRTDLDAIAHRTGIGGSVGWEQLLNLPGVLVPPQEDGNGRGPERAVKRLVGEALEALVSMRAEEGAALAKELVKHGTGLHEVVDQIEKRMPQVVERHQATLKKRIEDLVGEGAALSPADLAREVALIADKGDVTEEISRLRSHLDQLDSILEKGGPVGRRLDFLAQELVREVNTIGSKCADATVAHWVVDAKTRVERLREQVQNVE